MGRPRLARGRRKAAGRLRDGPRPSIRAQGLPAFPLSPDRERVDRPETTRRPATDASAAASGPGGWRNAGRWKPDVIEQRSASAMQIFDMLIADGISPARAAAWAANAEAESGSGRAMRQDGGGPGHGAFQWNAERRANFQRAFGHPYDQSTLREQLAFPEWEFANDP